MKSLAGVLALALALGCSKPESNGLDEVEPDELTPPDTAAALPRLPGMSGMEGDCPDPEPLTVEEWAGPADLVMVGTVTRVTAFVEPLIVNYSVEELETGSLLPSTDDCPGYVKGGFQLLLEDLVVLHGEAFEPVTISYGYTPAYALSLDAVETRPAPDGSFKLEWLGEGRFVPGHRLVAALYYDAHLGTYTPMSYEPVYQVVFDEEPEAHVYQTAGTLRSQPRSGPSCFRTGLDWLEGRTVADLAERLDAMDWDDPDVIARVDRRTSNIQWRVPRPPDHPSPEDGWAVFHGLCDGRPYWSSRE